MTTARDHRRAELLRGPAAVGAAGLGAAALLHLHDPHDSGSYGYCPFLALTGLPCPGCGGLRAVNDLTNGQLGAAASSNLLLVVAIPFVVVVLGLWAYDAWRGTSSTIPWRRLKPLLPVVLAVVLTFTVVRNLAFGAWLAP